MAAALAGLFFYSSCSPTEKAETKDYTRYVNTFIGAADNGQIKKRLRRVTILWNFPIRR